MKLIDCTSKTNTSVLNGRSIRYIVIHYTAGKTSKPGAAKSTALYFAKQGVNASADFIVDDEYAVRFNPDIKNRYCWHAGSSIGKYATKGGSLWKIAKSSNSIGIEVCSSSKTGEVAVPNADYFYFTDKVIENAAELTRKLMKDYGIDADHVIRHYDVTGKLCPGIKGWNADSGSEEAWLAFRAKITGTASAPAREEEMTQEEFNRLAAGMDGSTVFSMMDKLSAEQLVALLSRAEANLAKELEPAWSMADGWWQKAMNEGVVTSNSPQAHIRRCEMVAILYRLLINRGLIEKG